MKLKDTENQVKGATIKIPGKERNGKRGAELIFQEI